MVRLIHHQLTIALLAAIGVALAYAAIILVNDFRDHRVAIQTEIDRMADRHSEAANDFIGGYRAVLEALSDVDCVRGGVATACDGLFARLNQRFPYAINFAAAGANGDFFATGKAFPGGKAPNIAQRPFFSELAENALSTYVMDPHKGPISGQLVTGITVPIASKDGQFSGIVGVSLDFTELQDRWRAVTGTDDIPTMVFDKAGALIYGNSAASHIVPSDRDQASTFSRSLQPGTGQAALAGLNWHYRMDILPHAGWTVVAMHRAPYGLPEYLHDTSLPFQLVPPILALAVIGLWLAGRELRHLVQLEAAVASRTTELSAANARLARSARELETLTWVASHDLREPLRTVSTYVSLLERRYADRLDEDGLTFISYAREGAKRMNALVLALLDYLSIDRDQISCRLVQPAQTIAEIITQISAPNDRRHPIIMVHGTFPDLLVRPDHLHTIYKQLIENAVAHCPDDRVPTIHCGYEEGTFWVCDNGTGIEPQFREKAFGLFQRLGMSGPPAGTGVGLTLCTKVAGHYNGTIWITESPLGGCCFRFTLPLAQTRQDAA